MKILITGTGGFIGRNLFEYLAPRHCVLAPRSRELDLLDDGSVRDYLVANPVDVVIHAAGKPGHRNAKDPRNVFYADCRMYFNLIRNRDRYGRMLITGSGAVYDMRYYQPKMKEEYCGVHMPVDEHGFFRYVTSDLIARHQGVVDLRLFGVFGKYEDYAIRFISNAICKTLFDLPITLRQNRLFDYLYIEDLFPVIDYFIQHDAAHSEYNVTPDRAIGLLELAEKVREISGKDMPIIVAQEGMGQEYSGDNTRLRMQIPAITFTPIEEAIAQLYGWYERNKESIDKESLLADK